MFLIYKQPYFTFIFPLKLVPLLAEEKISCRILFERMREKEIMKRLFYE